MSKLHVRLFSHTDITLSLTNHFKLYKKIRKHYKERIVRFNCIILTHYLFKYWINLAFFLVIGYQMLIQQCYQTSYFQIWQFYQNTSFIQWCSRDCNVYQIQDFVSSFHDENLWQDLFWQSISKEKLDDCIRKSKKYIK